TAEELGDRNRRRPKSPGPVAAPVEPGGELLQVERYRARIGKKTERVAQPVRHERQADDDAQQRISEGGKRMVEAGHVRVSAPSIPAAWHWRGCAGWSRRKSSAAGGFAYRRP